jgi:chromosome segregation protein
VYIKQLELSHFKSFGSTTRIPLLPGFTVVSGPNGSGKSNLLDALLFALGLSGSKGMRAERLPDLVNQTQGARGHSTVETSVTVTFDLSDQLGIEIFPSLSDQGEKRENQAEVREWQVTRKLRVTRQGTYTSNYYLNGEPCTLSELHAQLSHLRIYPEGYNVVLQGDVTSIISMNSRQRREIIDELAGVADFDRKIAQAAEKLDTVKEREDRFGIVENELVIQRDRLAQDRTKAEKYQKLKAELQAKEQWEAVLLWRATQAQIQQLAQQLEFDNQHQTELNTQLTHLSQEIQQVTTKLEQLNAQVKALGESEHLALQSALASREAELRQLQRQQQELKLAQQTTVNQIVQTQQEIQTNLQTLDEIHQQQTVKTQNLALLHQARDQAQQVLDHSRAQASAIASTAEAWIQQQTALHQRIETLLQTLDPRRAEQARMRERVHLLARQVQEQTDLLHSLEQELAEKQAQLAQVQVEALQQQEQIQSLVQTVAIADQDYKTQQATQTRLLREQRDKQRQLDKLEAQLQAWQEAQGTYATRLILQTGLPGVCGLVAQLGQVKPQYQLALETAAGARLGYVVVEDDAVAATGIELLKQKRAGRATFLPLNKIQPAHRSLPPLRAGGAIDYALHLIDFGPRYQNIFTYIFGNTVVFETLNQARHYLGQYRIVTLEGDLLEATGAMTGGSRSPQQSIHFGTVEATESAEATALKRRLQEIDQLLDRLSQQLSNTQTRLHQQTQALTESRQRQRETQLRIEQLEAESTALSARRSQLQSQLEENIQELGATRDRLQVLEAELPRQEAQLQQQRQALAELEQSQAHSEWQQTQGVIRTQEAELNQRELALRSAQQHLQDLDNQRQRLQEKIQQSQDHLQSSQAQQTAQLHQAKTYQHQQQTIEETITELHGSLAQLERQLGTQKQARDRTERHLRERITLQQQLEWQLQKLQETQRNRHDQQLSFQTQLQAQAAELPNPLPDVPPAIGLEQLRQEVRSQQKRLQAMEPVNMLAIEEYQHTQGRLEELSQKLATLAEERTELLLRIENFTTLRQQAFREAFNAVNQNFQTIFAELSDGDGYLQLEDTQDPFRGGLNLVAHPKGKPVQRLASMSGGEKSLTALSFIFALQHYRPSPFYAFDEVDMFLDGANVDRLAKMIRQQAQQAQFIVVSLRRPMIESSERTIGVTQARGTYTQVLGLQLKPQQASL